MSLGHTLMSIRSWRAAYKAFEDALQQNQQCATAHVAMAVASRNMVKIAPWPSPPASPSSSSPFPLPVGR